ncbi:cysteine proteinase 15A-like [Trichoplusia ni]|uniref:Cysteine proteinase 15A-like n=1 Tax=Trichoplusia ni TaxID=7111 RepID=A0A7E5V9F9_TRINI|nr:cysteine proteinase 15A-like [Trichoplusia ni]
MRFVGVVLVFAAVAMASASDSQGKRHYEVSDAHNLFEEFIKTHNRQYKDDADRDVHFKAFVANLEKINKLNEQNPSATYGINKFADFTEEDRKQMFGLNRAKQ